MPLTSTSLEEAERQVTAAVERYQEVASSLDARNLPESGQRVAAKAVGRALQLLSFVLKRADASGVTLARLSELTGWELELVRELLERPPEPALVRRTAPAGVDAAAVAGEAARIEASQRLHALAQSIFSSVDDDSWSPTAEGLDELHGELERIWLAWRERHGAPAEWPLTQDSVTSTMRSTSPSHP